MLYIGVDLGTSAVKLLLMDEAGSIRRIVSKDYPIFFPAAGWSEQHPEDWYAAVITGIQELVEDCDPAKIGGIGVAGQMHGLVMLDEADHVIRPAILWNDGRSQAETDELNDQTGIEALRAYTGNIAFAGFTAPKLLWVKKHEPANFDRIAKVMLPKDYVNYCLTGTFATDYSDASGMLLLDVKNKAWSGPMIHLCGLTSDRLPGLYESWEVIGSIREEVALETGLSRNVKVCAGAGDNAAAAIGTGTVGQGACNISLGTSGTIFISSDSFRMDDHNALHAFAHADGGYHLMGCMLAAASCNKWWIEDILQTGDYAKEFDGVCLDRLGKNHVFYLPYLMGERAPHNDAYARSSFIGMSMDTTRADLEQAILEGVAFGLRDSLEAARGMGVSVSKSMICGGGGKSELWRRILANVMELELTIPETEQGPGYGAAILAAVACGVYPSVREATDRIITSKGSVYPDPGLSALYAERYGIYRDLYPALKAVFPKL